MSAVLAFDGCYDARRAAALSGVPRSTVYDWARKGVVVPSVSPEREKLWSYANLMALRIVSWLRHPKALRGEVKASAMSAVREALVRLDEAGLDLWDGRERVSPLWVDRTGRILIADGDQLRDLSGQGVLGEYLDLLGPFEGVDGAGPDLRRPRRHLRIVPGKCAGEPHVEASRLTTVTVAALAERGYTLEEIADLYPEEPRVALEESVDLERDLGTLPVAA